MENGPFSFLSPLCGA